LKQRERGTMKRYFSILILVILLSSCTQTSVDTLITQTPIAQKLDGSVTQTNTISEPAIKFTQTPISTPIPTAITSYIKDEPIDISNVAAVDVIGRSGTQSNSHVIGKDSGRWAVLTDKGMEIHDIKNNALLWLSDVAETTSILFSPNADEVLNVKKSTFQVETETGDKQVFPLPTISEKDSGKLIYSINFEKKLIAIGVQTPFYYTGSPIPLRIYSWGKTTPDYEVMGSNFQFSAGEKYLQYLSGMNLQIADAATGKTTTEFGIKNENAFWNTSWNDELFAISRRNSVEIWRLSDKTLLSTIAEKSDVQGQAFDFAFSPNNEYILVFQPKKSLRTWRISTGDMVSEESTTESNLFRISITDKGEIIHHTFLDVPGRNWLNPFNTYSNFRFTPDGQKLIFTTGIVNSAADDKEICNWDLQSQPICVNDRFWTFIYSARAKVIGFGSNGGQYFIKSFAEPEMFGNGWSKEEKNIRSIPKLSEKNGEIRYFYYDESSSLIIIQYSTFQTDTYGWESENTFTRDQKSVFIINRKSNARLLSDGRINRFAVSLDGKVLYEIRNQKEKPETLELVQYGTELLKTVSVTSLDVSTDPANKDKPSNPIIPEVSSMVISPDGKMIYLVINYSSGKARFLSIPLNELKFSQITDLKVDSDPATNMIITHNGDLAVFAQNTLGNLEFVDIKSGEIVKTLPLGGNPVLLAIHPDGKIIVVGDKENGILSVGLP
jgi:WD40 repeat protein